MKITCTCGAMIHDGTDGLPHKGHVIADRDWTPFWDAVDAALEAGAPVEAASMRLRNAAKSRRVWECTSCGRLWLESGTTLLCYTPDNRRANRAVDR